MPCAARSTPIRSIPSIPHRLPHMGYSGWSLCTAIVDTVEPYAIANNLPYHLVSDFELDDISTVTTNTAFNFFLMIRNFPIIKCFWHGNHEHFAPLVNALLKSYGSLATDRGQVLNWALGDYDSDLDGDD